MKLHPDVHLTQVKNNFKTLEQRCRVVHGNKYDYSQVVFLRATDKVEIICTTCGNIFKQKMK